MKNLILFAIAIFCAQFLNAQIDKENFEKTFNEELNDDKYSKRENHSGKYQYTKPQQVPSWFVNPPTSQDNEVYAIGISDPEMDTTAGLEMALYRAQVMANVLNRSTTQLLCDFFLNEVDNSSDIVYEHFSRINARIPEENVFDIVNIYRNSYDETLILIKYTRPKYKRKDRMNPIKLEVYKNEIQSSRYGNFESIYELYVESNSITEPNPMFYQITEIGPRHDVVSAQQEDKKQVPIYQLQYVGLPNSDSTKANSFSHGLWKEYYKSLMSYIINKAREKPENIKHISDAYQQNSLEKLTRGISVNRMRFMLTGITAKGNSLHVSLQELPLK